VKPHIARRLFPSGFEPTLVAGRVMVSVVLLVRDGEDGIDLTMRSLNGDTAVELVAGTAAFAGDVLFHSARRSVPG
jgi:hypothetical protein